MIKAALNIVALFTLAAASALLVGGAVSRETMAILEGVTAALRGVGAQ